MSTSTPTLSDADLVARAVRGDGDATDALVRWPAAPPNGSPFAGSGIACILPART